jgi:hypothetical protein
MVALAFFCPPAYFMVRKKWGAFFVQSFFYGCALLLLVTMVFAIIAPAFWLIGFAHAMWDLQSVLRDQAMAKQAELIAEKMAKKEK